VAAPLDVPAPPARHVQQAQKQATPRKPESKPEIRTAYSNTREANNSGLLAGAQPVVPAGSFDNRWTALR